MLQPKLPCVCCLPVKGAVSCSFAHLCWGPTPQYISSIPHIYIRKRSVEFLTALKVIPFRFLNTLVGCTIIPSAILSKPSWSKYIYITSFTWMECNRCSERNVCTGNGFIKYQNMGMTEPLSLSMLPFTIINLSIRNTYIGEHISNRWDRFLVVMYMFEEMHVSLVHSCLNTLTSKPNQEGLKGMFRPTYRYANKQHNRGNAILACNQIYSNVS